MIEIKRNHMYLLDIPKTLYHNSYNNTPNLLSIAPRAWAEGHQGGRPGPPNSRGALLPVYHVHVLSPASVYVIVV
jgi:hypothetical protein